MIFGSTEATQTVLTTRQAFPGLTHGDLPRDLNWLGEGVELGHRVAPEILVPGAGGISPVSTRGDLGPGHTGDGGFSHDRSFVSERV
jgi:hypothetical protein